MASCFDSRGIVPNFWNPENELHAPIRTIAVEYVQWSPGLHRTDRPSEDNTYETLSINHLIYRVRRKFMRKDGPQQ